MSKTVPTSLSFLLNVFGRPSNTKQPFQSCPYMAFVELETQHFMLQRARRRLMDFRRFRELDRHLTMISFDHSAEDRTPEDDVPYIFELNEIFIQNFSSRTDEKMSQAFNRWKSRSKQPFWIRDFTSSMIGSYFLPSNMLVHNHGVFWNWSDENSDYITASVSFTMLEIAHMYQTSGIEAAIVELHSVMNDFDERTPK